MKYFARNILPFFSLFIIVQICFTSCENDIKLVNSITSEQEKQLPVEAGKYVEIMYSDSAQVRAKLTAPVLNRYTGKKNFMELPNKFLLVLSKLIKKVRCFLKEYFLFY